MRRLLVGLLHLAPGCLLSEKATVDERCLQGQAPLLVELTTGGGFVPADYFPTIVSVNRNGDLFFFHGTRRMGSDSESGGGTGRLFAPHGGLYNLTLAQAQEEVERLSSWEPRYVVGFPGTRRLAGE